LKYERTLLFCRYKSGKPSRAFLWGLFVIIMEKKDYFFMEREKMPFFFS